MIKSSLDDYEFNFHASRAREKSYKLGIKKTIFTYLVLAFFLLLILYVMRKSNISSLTYAVFYLCITLFLKNTISKILDSGKSNEQHSFLKLSVMNDLKDKE